MAEKALVYGTVIEGGKGPVDPDYGVPGGEHPDQGLPPYVWHGLPPLPPGIDNELPPTVWPPDFPVFVPDPNPPGTWPPPGTVWPPLDPSDGITGKGLLLVIVVGGGRRAYRWIVTDKPIPPPDKPPDGGGKPPDAQPKR